MACTRSRSLTGRTHFTLDTLIAVAFDSYLPAFAARIPALVASYDAMPGSDPLKAKLSEQIGVLRAWDYRWSVASVPTSLAVYWGEEMHRRMVADSSAAVTQLLGALSAASDSLTADFGNWRTPWGTINRYQRLTGAIDAAVQRCGAQHSGGIHVVRGGARLASFAARTYPGTKKRYGTSGNSFVAVVEFGDSVRAKAVTAGGESGDPASPHFNDQAERYSTGNLRDVYFYPSQLVGHTERTYHPGGKS